MTDTRFAFTVEVRRGGVLLGAAAASASACVEDALFRGVLRGAIANDGTMPEFTVAPVWKSSGPPAVAALTVAHAGDPPLVSPRTYERDVFRHRAQAIIRDLCSAARVEKGDVLEWDVVATEPPPAPRRFRARASRAPYPFHPGSLPGVPAGTFAVSIEAAVLDEIRRVVVACGTIECAGLLVGRLIHDRKRRAATLRVTGHIPVPAGRGGASSVHFSFDGQTFLAARAGLGTVADAAIVAGWTHSHPACADCPRTPECRAETVFFSPDDVQVHASAFPAAYMVGLVGGKVAHRRASDPGFRLYGWDGGAVVERVLHVVDAPAALVVAGGAG